MHFIRSLYQKETYANGFSVVGVHLEMNYRKLHIKQNDIRFHRPGLSRKQEYKLRNPCVNNREQQRLR